MARFALRDDRPCRLCLAPDGPHRFGGRSAHKGVTPRGAHIALHLVLLLDLRDPNCPVRSDGPVTYLPLYYPLKYGVGGPELQYRVVSDTEIEILHISDRAPDAEDQQYVRVPELPASPARILPLTYEQARILAFAGGYFQPDEKDRNILRDLTRHHPLILVGGYRRLPVNAGDPACRNPGCESFGRRVRVTVIASVPPVPVNGSDEFWHEYQGGDVKFYFCLCNHCATVIAFNVSS